MLKPQFILLLILTISYAALAQTTDEKDSLKSYQLDQVIITGTRIAKEKGKVPASITVVERKDIERSGANNVLPVLNNMVPGLFLNNRNVSGFGVGPQSAGNISIRGISGIPNTRVLVLIDGQPQFMGLFGHPIADSYMSSDIEKVEVMRGPASILYGSNAMGGAINIITRNVEKDGLSLNGKAAYGSFNTQQYMASAGYKKGNFSIYGALNHDYADGHRENDDDVFKSTTAFLKTSLTINANYKINLDGNLSDSEFNNPGPDIADTVFTDNFYRYTRGRAAFSLDNDYDWMEGSFRFFYNFGEHEFYDGWNSDDYNTGITFYQNLKLITGNILTLGIDYKTFGGMGSNENTPPPFNRGLGEKYEMDEIEFYGLLQQQLADEKITLNAGVRYTDNNIYGDAITPTFGAAYRIFPFTTLKASAAKAFRSPTLVDLFIFPPANEDLQPEEMWNYEFSVQHAMLSQRLNLEATIYKSEGENLIQAVPTGQPGPPQRINTGAFSNSGLELQGSFEVSRMLSFTSNYSYMNLENPLPYAPEHEINLITNYRYQIFNLQLGMKYVNDLYTNIENLTTQSYTLIDARVSAKVLPNLSLFVDGENLLDLNYQVDYLYPMPGITVLGGFHFRY